MAQFSRELAQVNVRDQFAHGFSTHARAEDVRAEGVAQLAIAILLDEVHFLQPLQVAL